MSNEQQNGKLKNYLLGLLDERKMALDLTEQETKIKEQRERERIEGIIETLSYALDQQQEIASILKESVAGDGKGFNIRSIQHFGSIDGHPIRGIALLPLEDEQVKESKMVLAYTQDGLQQITVLGNEGKDQRVEMKEIENIRDYVYDLLAVNSLFVQGIDDPKVIIGKVDRIIIEIGHDLAEDTRKRVEKLTNAGLVMMPGELKSYLQRIEKQSE